MIEIKNTNFYVYSYFNKKTQEFQFPITTDVPPESFALAVRRSLIMKPQEALKGGMDECRLFVVGTFNFYNGLLEALEKPLEILDCLEVLNRVSSDQSN